MSLGTSSRPLVSVLTPSFNQARYLEDCIDSVESQTYRPLEHVICDGGSRDGTLEILRRSSEHVRWTSEPDRGQGHALNKAFRRSSGEIIGWLNSDDAYADRRTVEWAVGAFRRDPSLDVVFGHALLVNESGLVLQVIWTPPLIRSLLALTHYIFQPTLFFRRSAFDGADPVREDLEFVLDRELVLRLADTARFTRIPRILSIDRHQRERKVEKPEFELEVALHAGYREPTLIRRVLTRTAKVAIRVSGTPTIASARSRIIPAISLEWPSLSQRLKFQLLTPRRRMPFSER